MAQSNLVHLIPGEAGLCARTQGLCTACCTLCTYVECTAGGGGGNRSPAALPPSRSLWLSVALSGSVLRSTPLMRLAGLHTHREPESRHSHYRGPGLSYYSGPGNRLQL